MTMTLKRKPEMDRIREVFAYLTAHIEQSASGNLFDINVYAENFYRDLLNLIFGYSLENINISEKNVAAIDLGDSDASLAIQVTSTSNFAKIKHTVDLFIEKKLYRKYNSLKVLILTSKKQYRHRTIGDSNTYIFNVKEDIWDVSKLLDIVNDKKLPEVIKIKKFLEQEVSIKTNETVPLELRTFQQLIRLVSNDTHPVAGKGYLDEPDPKRKIENRFSDHEMFLKNLYKDLYTEYGDVLQVVRRDANFSATKVRRLRLYLRHLSDEILNECGGNPQIALKELVEYFQKRMSKSGYSHNLEAIRFFLVDELIQCNVFPLERNTNVDAI